MFHHYFTNLFLMALSIFFVSLPSYADEEATLFALQELYQSKKMLQEEIKTKNEALKTTVSEEEKQHFQTEITALKQQRDTVEVKFEKIATGIDVSNVKPSQTVSDTTLTEDFQILITPLVASAKEATKEMRQKSALHSEIEYYKTLLPNAVQAHDNVEKLIRLAKSKELKKELKPLKKHWTQEIQLLSSNLNASLHQLDMLDKNSGSFLDTFKESTKSFFEQRGFYLFEGFMAFVLVITVMQLIHMLIIKVFPIFTRPSRKFFLRLLDLLYRIFMIILAIVIPMGIFYIEEDWFLFSIGILVLFGIVWTFRHLISQLWEQALLLLNVGAVRENERILYEGLPWRVRNINIFTVLENPTSGMRLRIPIESLLGLISRPVHPHEPWFPCKLGDWVLLTDGYYGQVKGISLELIELEDLGGGHRTYLLQSFLQLSPTNISTDFRVVQTCGISYRHQKESTSTIVQQLEAFVSQKIHEEGYDKELKKLLVQFDNAGDSSLNLTIIANFDGSLAPLYFRLRRSIGRWFVDACNQYDWEIPFPQLTVHQPNN